MIQDVNFEKIHAATIQILGQVGIRIPDEEVLTLSEQAGLEVDRERKCIKFSTEHIAMAISRAPKEVRLCHRSTDDFVSLNHNTRFMPSGTGVSVFDRATGNRRESRTADILDLIRLQDVLSNLDIARPMVTANEFGENSDLVECYLALRYTGKPFIHRTLSEKNARILIEMLAIAMGGHELLRQRPPFAAVYCPKSPLSMTPEGARSMLKFAAAGVPVLVLSMAMGGATAPVTIPGIVTLINAEVLAGISLLQMLFPGTSVLYGSVASVLDMRTAVLALGAPERGIINSFSAELAKWYGIPSVMGGLSTDAKQLDEQAGFEKALTLWPLMGKASLIFGMGVMDSANTYSFEQLLLDDEMIGAIKRAHYGAGVSLQEDEIAAIKQTGFSGEYLTSPHTLKNFRAHWLPNLMTRKSFDNWTKERKSLTDLTRATISKILDTPSTSYLPEEVDREIREVLLGNGINLPADL